MQQIEALKFEQDVDTGLSYFDAMNKVTELGNKEVEGLKKIYKQKWYQLNDELKKTGNIDDQKEDDENDFELRADKKNDEIDIFAYVKANKQTFQRSTEKIEFRSRPMFLDEARNFIKQNQLAYDVKKLSTPLAADKVLLNVEAEDALRINHLQVDVVQLTFDHRKFMPLELLDGSETT